MNNLSVVICTIFKNGDIFETIQSLLSNKSYLPSKCEIIVIDNRITIPDQDKLVSFCKERSEQIQYFWENSIGLSAARHLGLKKAKSNIIAYVDDDVVVNSNWIDTLFKIFENSKINLATGPSRPYDALNLTQFLQTNSIFLKPQGWICPSLSLHDLGVDNEFVDPDYVWGLNFVMRKQLLFELGGFNPDLVPKTYQMFQGDGETGLTRKFKAIGHKAFYSQGLAVLHKCPAERTEKEYLTERHFYNGVSDSFTYLRSNKPSNYRIYFYILNNLLRISIYYLLLGVLNFTEKLKLTELFSMLSLRKSTLPYSYFKGLNFHLRYYLKSSRVRNWVHLENYLDSKIEFFEIDND
jgi:glycosyltransferase involved in cell wall biosynthesis